MIIRILLSFCLLSAAAVQAVATCPVNYKGEIIANAGSGNFAPYYIASNNYGILTQPRSTLARAAAWKEMETGERFSYGFGIDIIGGYASSTPYLRYSESTRSFYPVPVAATTVWRSQIQVSLHIGRTERDRIGTA